MKKLVLFVFLMVASLAFAGPYDLRINQRNSTDTGDIGR